MINKGIKLENHFVSFLNGKTINDLFKKWRVHIKRMFPNIKETDVIHAYRYENTFAKPDFVIEVNGVSKRVSLKSGKNPSVHEEFFKKFFDFLREIGVSYKTRATISLYHFGKSKFYGYTIGSPLSRDEIVAQFSKEIVEANKELNQRHIIAQVTRRAVITGVKGEENAIDYFYYGNLEKGFLVDEKQIFESVYSRKEISDKFIHFGELVYQPSGRSRDRKDYLYSRIHWPILQRLFYEANDENNFLDRKSPEEYSYKKTR